MEEKFKRNLPGAFTIFLLLKVDASKIYKISKNLHIHPSKFVDFVITPPKLLLIPFPSDSIYIYIYSYKFQKEFFLFDIEFHNNNLLISRAMSSDN